MSPTHAAPCPMEAALTPAPSRTPMPSQPPSVPTGWGAPALLHSQPWGAGLHPGQRPPEPPCLGTEEGAGSPATLTDTACLWEESGGDTLPDGTLLWASPLEVCGVRLGVPARLLGCHWAQCHGWSGGDKGFPKGTGEVAQGLPKGWRGSGYPRGARGQSWGQGAPRLHPGPR